MEPDASKKLWGEIDDLWYASEPAPAITVKPTAHVTCHIPTLDILSTDNSTNEYVIVMHC